MERRKPPETEEGWYALHDFRRIDWSAWRSAPSRERDRALREGIDFLSACEGVPEGDSGAFTVTGHGADLLFVHLRPTLDDLNAVERRFERTAFAEYVERTDSFVSVTEVSGYMSESFFEDGEAEDAGTSRYIQSRLEPEVPEADYVSFYPMDKRRDGEYNWYDLPFEERAELMASHGDIGRYYAGDVTQIITSAIGFDDWEWGVTLFSNDPTEIKRLLYEMRFDPSSSRYADFGTFYVGQRFPPADLRAVLAGDPVPTGEDAEATVLGTPEAVDADGAPGPHREPEAGGDTPHGEATGSGAGPAGRGSGHGDDGGHGGHADDGGLQGELADIGVYAGQPHGEDVHAVVVYSEADPEDLFEEAASLREQFDHYDTHRETAVYESEDGPAAVVSAWETESGADTAGGFLSDLPGVVRQAGDDTGDTWGTMGMFYTVAPDRREEFVEKFDTVGEVLAETEGHLQTDLLVNREDENDMFIASRWESREHATEFFRSEAFRDTVDWGRDVLVERPRHVFLA